MNRLLFIQNPPVNEMQSFKKSQYQEIMNGKKIHDTNIESYQKNNDVLIRGHIDNKPIYYNSSQKQNRPTSFSRNKKVSFANSISTNHRPPIIRDLTPFHLMIRPSLHNTNNMSKTRTKKYKRKKTDKKKEDRRKNKRQTKRNKKDGKTDPLGKNKI
jgi:hypothetical protein